MNQLNLESLIALIAGISGLVVAFGKYAMPYIAKWVGMRDKEREIEEKCESLGNKLFKLETNHLEHVHQRLDVIENKLDTYGNRLTRIETKLEK